MVNIRFFKNKKMLNLVKSYIMCIYIYYVYIYILCIYIYHVYIYIYIMYIYIYIMYIYIYHVYIYIMYIYIYHVCIYIYIYIYLCAPSLMGKSLVWVPKYEIVILVLLHLKYLNFWCSQLRPPLLRLQTPHYTVMPPHWAMPPARFLWGGSNINHWLVVSTILKNMKVSWDYYSQYMEK